MVILWHLGFYPAISQLKQGTSCNLAFGYLTTLQRTVFCYIEYQTD